MKKTKYLIIGAGISGLTFASYAKEDYIIIEKDNRPGGFCKTTRKGDYVWDYAGHFFHFKTEEFKEKFINSLDKDEFVTQDKKTYIYYKNNLIDYPFQMNIHELEKEEFIDCLYDLFNKEEKNNYDNFLDMLYGKFGKSITEKFLKPYNEKLYAIDLTKLDKDAMGRFFPYADKEAIIKNMKKMENSSYNSSFLYPKKGAETIIDILLKDIDSNRILLNTKVTSIDEKNKVAILDNGEKIEYQYLINTIPFNTFLTLFDSEKLNAFSKELSYNKVLVFNLGFDKKSKFNKEHWLYIPDKSINFYRVGFYDNILNADKLSMYIEIGYSKNQNVNDIDKQLELTLQNLNKMGIIDDSFNLVDYESIVMDPAYVHINSEHEKEIKDIKNKLEKDNIFTIGRYGGWTYCSMEDCMLEAKTLYEEIK